jgi:phosphate transport system permease protein
MITDSRVVALPSTDSPAGETHFRRRRLTGGFMIAVTTAFTLLALVPLIWIVIYVTIQGLQGLNISFFTQLPAALGQLNGGVLNAIEGTILVTGIAIVIAVPVGVLAAFYAARNPNKPLGVAVRFGTDVLSGVPSIVIGLFGYALIVKPQGHYSALAGGAAISIIMVPTIIRTSEEMIKLVPGTLREASLGLGAPEWRTALNIILPAAISGVVTGIILAIARGVGETAPLIFTVLGNDRFEIGQIVKSGIQNGQSVGKIFGGVLEQPTDTMTLLMWRYSQQPYAERVQQAWTMAMVLMVFVLLANVAARLVVYWQQRRIGKL